MRTCFYCIIWVKIIGSSWKKSFEAYDTLLFDLKNDPGETKNLFESNQQQARNLFQDMEKEYLQMGKPPESLVVRTFGTESHLQKISH